MTRGGFGNILYNYIVAYALARKYNMKPLFVPDTDEYRLPMNRYKIFNKLEYTQVPNSVPKIYERGFQYFPIFVDQNVKEICIDGYFQSYKYSDGLIPVIKKELLANIPSDYERIVELYRQKTGNYRSIMVHVRRGDYLKFPNIHPIPTDEYFSQGLEWLYESDASGYKLLVFSDDLDYLKTWNLLKNVNHEIIDISDPVDAFWLMTLCDNFLISNSSLSLLAYHFRERADAKLVLPAKWFGPDGPKFNMEDLVQLNSNVKFF